MLASGSVIAKVVMAAGAWLLSWSSFTGGLLLAGFGTSKRFAQVLRRNKNASSPSTLQGKDEGAPDDPSILN